MATKFKFKHFLIILFFLGLFGFTGYKVYKTIKAKNEAAATPSGGAPGGMGGGRGVPGGGRVQQVQTGLITNGKISEKVALTGSLRPKQQVDVNPRISGRITQINVDVGQSVARGTLIATIEDDEIRQQIERSKASIAVADASIAQREAELSNAKVELDRRKQLVKDGVLSQQELDGLEMRHRVAASQLELARAQRRQTEAEQRELNIRQSQTRVFSPIAGIVARRQLDLGAMAGANTPIVTIVSVSPMVILANAAEQDISRIKKGAQVNVTIDSLPGQKFTGRVMRISPLLDPQTRNGQVEIEIPNTGGLLKGEMFARVELNLGSERETLLLPRDALVYRGEKPGVFTIEADKAKFLEVETGLAQEDKVEVLGGLKLGDKVITQGVNLVKDGDRVAERGAGGPGGGQGGGRQGGGPGQQQAQGGSQSPPDGQKQGGPEQPGQRGQRPSQ
ncbi:MAG: efflux RND transporter periplasmic adaptor subunit [Acidobacteriota bacterium]|nr:efflux RND transporter periplasmic adaptor subunit [Acidobacteriota bacterium]